MKNLPYVIIIILIVLVLAYACYKITQMPLLVKIKWELVGENEDYYVYKDQRNGYIYQVRKIDIRRN